MPQKAYRFPAEVQSDGKVEVTLPLPPGSRVEVVVLTQEDEFQDLVEAAASSTDFWDNPVDDAEWNDA
jgi:hypothetical protein